MMSATPGWQGAGPSNFTPVRGPRRAAEVLGVLVAFFWFWPAAAGYLVWKFIGYPGLGDLRASLDRGMEGVRSFRPGMPFGRPGPIWEATGFGSSGNAAFDEYRRGEIDRLERERRRLDDEAREFRTFVDDLKKAKDREEFDAYMARRRQNGPTTA